MAPRHLVPVLGFLLAVLSSCARPHLTETFGRSNRAAFAAQAPPQAQARKATTGLDSQEASIISGSYRRSLAPKTREVKDQPILLIAPQGTGGAQAQPLPPSVPSYK